jgi:alpha-D-xyloside xylohydrolase
MQIRHALCCFALIAASASLRAQTPVQTPTDVTQTPGGQATGPRLEPPVEGFVRKDRDTVTLALAEGKTLTLHDFDFNGDPVDTAKLHLHQLSPGVYEISSLAYSVGYWRFRVNDAADYFGLGEHFDTLNHAHSIVQNLSMDNGRRKGSNAYKCSTPPAKPPST